jgi:hypothetical protein
MDRPSRSKLRIGHLHRCHRLALRDRRRPGLLFTLAQGHARPCSWAHGYAILPDHPQPFSCHFSFDQSDLQTFRQAHPERSLSWLDSGFMLELALDQLLRRVPGWLPCPADSLGAVDAIDMSSLTLHRLNGDFPQLEALLAQCGEYYLLHQELQAVLAFPRLHSVDRTAAQGGSSSSASSGGGSGAAGVFPASS